jgi:hypothetical protein
VSSTDNYRFFQYLRLNLKNRSEKNTVSFHTYLRVSDDLKVNYSDDPNWRLYNGYLQWDTRLTELSLGRQWLPTAPGHLTLDGIRLSVGKTTRHQLTGFIGTENPYSRHISTSGWEKAATGGISFETQALDPLTLGLGWYQKNRSGDVAFREVNLKAKARLPHGLRLLGRLDVNLLTDRLQKGIFRLRYRGNKIVQLFGEYKHYEPRLFYKSYYQRFEPESNEQVRGGAVIALNSEIAVNASYTSIFFKEKRSGFLSIGASCPYGSATYYRGDGFGSEENGIAVGASLPLAGETVEIFADFDYSRYRFYEDEDQDYLYRSIAGIQWRPNRNVEAGFQIENLNNDVFSKDVRLLVKFAYNFRTAF